MGRKAAMVVKVGIALPASTHQVLSVMAFNANESVDSYILSVLCKAAAAAQPLPLFPDKKVTA